MFKNALKAEFDLLYDVKFFDNLLKIINSTKEQTIFAKMLENIFSFGVKDQLDGRRKRLANQFTSIAVIAIFMSACLALITQAYEASIFILVFMFSIACSYLVGLRYSANATMTYLFTNVIFVIFFFDAYSDFTSGSYLFIFVILLSISFGFEFNTKIGKQLMFAHIILLIVLETLNIFLFEKIFGLNRLTSNQSQMIYFANIVSSVGVVGYFLFLIMRTNSERQVLLKNEEEEQNKMLQFERERGDYQSVLVAEMHHRLKNNLAIIQGIISFKQHQISQRTTEEVLNESLKSIQTIALAHNIQIIEKYGVFVPFFGYSTEIADNRQLDFPIFEKKEGNLKNENFINIKDAIPLGLILDETLSIFSLMLSDNETCKLEYSTAAFDSTVIVQINFNHSDFEYFTKMLSESYINDLAEQINAQIKSNFEKGIISFSLIYELQTTKMIDSDHL